MHLQILTNKHICLRLMKCFISTILKLNSSHLFLQITNISYMPFIFREEEKCFIDTAGHTPNGSVGFPTGEQTQQMYPQKNLLYPKTT